MGVAVSNFYIDLLTIVQIFVSKGLTKIVSVRY